MKLGQVIVLLIIVCSLAAQLTDILVLDCKKTLHVLPNTLFEAHINLTSIIRTYNGVINAFKDRLKCVCPNMDDNFFTNAFGYSPQTLLFAFRPDLKLDLNMCNITNKNVFGSITDVTLKSMFGNTAFSMPSTCTLSSVMNGQPCTISYSLPRSRVKFQLVVDTCPSENGVINRVPFISLSCVGEDCKKIGMPCGSTASCGDSLTCSAVQSFWDGSADQFLKSYGILDLQNCPSGLSLYGPGLWKELVNFLIPGIWKIPDPSILYTSISFCIPDTSTTTQNDWLTTSTSGGITTVNVVGLGWWDGALPSGELANSNNRKDGIGFAKPSLPPVTQGNVVPILSMSCDNVVHVFPQHPLGFMSVSNISVTIQKISDILYSVRSCRSDWTLEKHRALVLFNQLDPWLKMLVKDQAFSVEFPNTPFKKLDFINSLPGIMKLPSTCTYDTYMKNGVCSATYTGLTGLLNTDIKIHLIIRRCSSNPDGIPSINLWCEGPVCNALTSVKFCAVNSDCPTGTSCVNVGPDIPFQYTQFFPSSSCFSTPIPDYRKALQHAIGQNYDGGYDLRICSYDYKTITQNPQSITNWLGSAATISGDQITVWGLGSYSGPMQCFGILANDIGVCNGNGICKGTDSCSCKAGFTGQKCDSVDFSCFGKFGTDSGVCSGNGVCNGTDSCSCKAGFTGQKCETKGVSVATSNSINWLLLVCLMLFARIMQE